MSGKAIKAREGEAEAGVAVVASAVPARARDLAEFD